MISLVYSVRLSRSVVSDSLRPQELQHTLSITSFRSLLRLISIKSVMPSNHRILCRPLLLPPSIFPSIRVFSNESALRMRWPKYWNFSFNINPSNEQTGLLSFRMDWLDQSISEEKSDKTEQQRRSEGKALRGKKKICHVVASVDHKIEESSEWNVLEAYRFCVIDIMH